MSAVLESPRAMEALRLRPFHASDYVALHDLCARVLGRPLVDQPEAAGREYAHAGPAHTAVLADVILGAAGLVVIWPGRASAWAILNPAIRGDARLALWVTIQIRKMLPVLAAGHHLHRIEAQARRDDGHACRWLLSLGFEVEGPLDRFGPDGADYIGFVRLFEGCA